MTMPRRQLVDVAVTRYPPPKSPRTRRSSSGSITSAGTTLGTSPEYWRSHRQKLLGKPRRVGGCCATSAERLKAIATKRNVHHVDNAFGGLATG